MTPRSVSTRPLRKHNLLLNRASSGSHARQRPSHAFRLVSSVALAAALLTGCIKASQGQLDSFKADGGNAWEYLIDRTINLGSSGSSYGTGFASAGSGSSLTAFSGMDQSMAGSSGALVGSLADVGLCYWYTKIEKAGPIDFGYQLDYSDGTPNLGVRNNLIARAGVPLTANVVRMTDVLQAMHDAGGELRRMQAEISEAAIKIHKVLLDAAGPAMVGVGTGTVALAGLGEQGRQKVKDFARPITSGIQNRLNAPNLTVSSADSIDGVKTRTLTFLSKNNAQLRGIPGQLTSDLISVQTFKTGAFRNLQITQIAMDSSGNKFYRQSIPGNPAVQRFKWATLDESALEKLKLEAGSPSLDPNKIFQSFKTRTAALGISAKKRIVMGANATKTGVKNVVNWCNASGKALNKAICLSTVGVFAAGAYTWNRLGVKGSDRVNDAAVAQRVQNVLENPQVVENVAQIMRDFEKQKNISSRLLEELRKQLIAKSAMSTLGSCTDAFGTEILTTPGVAGTNYESQLGGIDSSGLSGSSLGTPPPVAPSLTDVQATPSESFDSVPSFNDDGSTSSTTADSGLSGGDASFPSATDPLPADMTSASAATDFSSDTSTFDSSLGAGDPSLGTSSSDSPNLGDGLSSGGSAGAATSL